MSLCHAQCHHHKNLLWQVGQQTLVRSVPGELNTDKNEALRLAQGRGCISKQLLMEVGTHQLSLCKHPLARQSRVLEVPDVLVLLAPCVQHSRQSERG